MLLKAGIPQQPESSTRLEYMHCRLARLKKKRIGRLPKGQFSGTQRGYAATRPTTWPSRVKKQAIITDKKGEKRKIEPSGFELRNAVASPSSAVIG